MGKSALGASGKFGEFWEFWAFWKSSFGAEFVVCPGFLGKCPWQMPLDPLLHAISLTGIMVALLKDTHFRRVAEYAKLDDRKRIGLGETRSRKGTAAYSVYQNKAGQIILDPVRLVPESEMWLFKNKKALAAVREGIEQAGRGEVHDLGSFAQYAGED